MSVSLLQAPQHCFPSTVMIRSFVPITNMNIPPRVSEGSEVIASVGFCSCFCRVGLVDKILEHLSSVFNHKHLRNDQEACTSSAPQETCIQTPIKGKAHSSSNGGHLRPSLQTFPSPKKEVEHNGFSLFSFCYHRRDLHIHP